MQNGQNFTHVHKYMYSRVFAQDHIIISTLSVAKFITIITEHLHNILEKRMGGIAPGVGSTLKVKNEIKNSIFHLQIPNGWVSFPFSPCCVMHFAVNISRWLGHRGIANFKGRDVLMYFYFAG